MAILSRQASSEGKQSFGACVAAARIAFVVSLGLGLPLGFGLPMVVAAQANPPSVSTPQAVPQSAAPGSKGATESGQLLDVRPALATSVWAKRGEHVTEIRFEGVTFEKDDVLPGELTQKAGAALDPDKVRADLRRLFASGRYRDISVRSEAASGGIALVYAGVPRYYIGRVQIEGVKSERLSSLLEFATRLDPGTAYTEALVPASVTGVKESLARNGYYQPKVEVATKKDDVGDQINFDFKVDIGPQARVGEVAIEGQDVGFTPEEFRKKAKLNCGFLARLFSHGCRPKVTRETTSTALSSLRTQYQKKDRLEATVSVQKETYSPPRKQLDYDFAANQGPVVKVVVKGAKLSKSRLHLLVPVFEEGAVDNDLINEGAYNIRDYLQQKGYFDVTDSVQIVGEKTQNVTVQYTVDEGNKHKVLAVEIKGNKYFDTNTIAERLSTKKADLYIRSGRYSQELVKSDADAIKALYRANGFSKAKVTPTAKDEDQDRNGKDLKVAQIAVTFTIVEGPQQKFGSVELTGVDPSRLATVKGLLQSEEDQPFSLLTLSGDRDSVLSYYVSHGFDQARVEIKQDVENEDKTATDVQLNVTEGQQVFIDRILLSGIKYTRPSLVQGQLTVQAGEPLDQAALLQTQRNLYNLALFNEVNVAAQNPTGEAPQKNVLVQVTEAKRWDVTYGFGFEAQTGTPAQVPGTRRGGTAAQNGRAGVSPRVTGDVSRINLFGTDKSLTLHASYGLLERVATLSFNNPRLLNHPNLTLTISGGYSNVQDITTFASSTLQGDARVTQKVRKTDTFIYDFQYRRVEVDPNSLEIAQNLIPLLSEPVRVGGPGITWFHDTRSPSPLDAGKGRYFSVQEFIASSKFGSQTDFNRVDLSQSTYYTFGKKKYVFARNTRVGFENNFGANPNIANQNCAGIFLQTNATCNAVPLPERLYAGGGASHRGFPINGAGPRDLTTGFPVGGSGAVVNTFELRLPPPTLPIVGDNVSFVIFHDMGNVFQHPGDMFKSIKNFRQPNEATCRNVAIPPGTPGNTPADRQNNAVGTCNFNYYSHALGLGARYKTPVGPIRVDFSYNLNPPVYPVFQDFNNDPPHVGQGNHFNFFFSIGQSF
ncbi:MAG: BamA/TamA family outer membrane protein [Acidobacteriota bacterium]|nr:BamA/TamA family outer membrane protein [Acidobacteriota bacterium]